MFPVLGIVQEKREILTIRLTVTVRKTEKREIPKPT